MPSSARRSALAPFLGLCVRTVPRARWTVDIVLGASAVVEVADLGAVEDLLCQRSVHLVVDVAGPGRRRRPRGDLRREFGEDLLEVACTLAAGGRVAISRSSSRVARTGKRLPTTGIAGRTGGRKTAARRFRRPLACLGNEPWLCETASRRRDRVRPCRSMQVIDQRLMLTSRPSHHLLFGLVSQLRRDDMAIQCLAGDVGVAEAEVGWLNAIRSGPETIDDGEGQKRKESDDG